MIHGCFSDTIVALSTPLSVGALAVLRLSGREVFSVAEKSLKFFHHASLETVPSFSLRRAFFVDFESKKTVLDDVQVAVMREPKSYTGENMIEITCHGNPFIVKTILAKIQKSGARLAFPGEFTQRAFLNGKKDLTQAEAVADLIHSRNQEAVNRSLRLLAGELTDKIEVLTDLLEHLLLYLEAELDFAEEDIDFVSQDDYLKKLNEILLQIESLSKSFDRSSVSREGVTIALMGAPNVGKSSLFNALLKTNRAIVSEDAGTTRDMIDADIILDGHRLVFFDTAGVRKTKDSIEKKGVLKTFEFLKKADFILFLCSLDCLDEKQLSLLKRVQKEKMKNQKIYLIVNKNDRLNKTQRELIESKMEEKPFFFLSALKENSVESFEKKLVEEIEKTFAPSFSTVVLNQRHYDLLQKSYGFLLDCKNLSVDGFQDAIVVLLKEAVMCLKEILGKQYDSDILKKIFSNFCIGK